MTNPRLIIGADEAGYGSLAGPMVMVAVAAWSDCTGKMPDSKTVKKLETLNVYRDEVLERCVDSEVHCVSAQHVDRDGGTYICQRTGLALVIKRLVERLHADPATVRIIVDGAIELDLPFAYEPIPQADAKYWPVSAASILAKHRQITEMDAIHAQYPQWGFNQHRGYGTEGHKAAVALHGVSPVHRRSNRFIGKLKPYATPKGREK